MPKPQRSHIYLTSADRGQLLTGYGIGGAQALGQGGLGSAGALNGTGISSGLVLGNGSSNVPVAPGPVETAGVDFSFTHPSGAAIAAAGYKFVLGYLSNTPSKNLSAAEINDFRANGLKVALVWEAGSSAVQGGATQGATDGTAANNQMNALGNYATTSVVFFAVDYAATSADWSTIQAYANAFNSHTSRPVGIYGSYAVIEQFVTPLVQPVQYGWQTSAWSSGQISSKANIYQRQSPSGRYPTIAGASGAYDEDVILKDLGSAMV